MTSFEWKDFLSKVSPEVLSELHQIADSQGRQLEEVIAEALRHYIKRQQIYHPRQHVMTALASSLIDFDELYRELAK